MSRPPRIQPFDPHKSPIYFLTICVSSRQDVLANVKSFQALEDCLNRMNRWHCYSYVIMPDHIHFLISPMEMNLKISEFIKWLKRWMNEKLSPDWAWQEGGFDHLLRSNESAQQKWEYLRENPVRKGLCKSWQDWPYSRGFRES